ncbi:MAG: helix-turn-helix transcriptional regulator [Peptostreptococcaceae bacterium]|nr:helix-turn-helix transcriptional regulator [Peptostreptococcaceae bacterium]
MIGAKIRKLRQEKGMTLSELAKQVNFTASYISQIERSIIDPSLSSLRKIALALDTPIYSFLSEENADHFLIKAEKRKKLALPNSTMIYEFVTPMASNKTIRPKMEIIYIHMDAESWSNEDYLSHKVDECIFVLHGSFHVYLGEEKYVLEEGDSIYIQENVSHRIYNPLKTVTTAISCFSPSLY